MQTNTYEIADRIFRLFLRQRLARIIPLKRLRWITKTLFSGDLFTHTGDSPALTDDDIVGPALAAEQMFHATALSDATGSTIRRLAAREPQMLAVMHGSSTRTRDRAA